MLHIYGEHTPTFEELSKEFLELGRRKHYEGDTWVDRLTYLRQGLLLHRAAYWQRLTPLRFAPFGLRHVLRRVAPRFACVLLAWYLLTSQLPDQKPGVLLSVAVYSLVFAVVWSPIAWVSAQWTLAWAERLRTARQERERQLCSPEGWQGWRAVPAQDGGWELTPVKSEHHDDTAA
jgi:hypothetical protein